MTDAVHDPTLLRLGKKRGVIQHPNDLMLADIVDAKAAFPEVPKVVDVAKGVPFAMYANDKWGDCTFAGVGNYMRAATRGAIAITDHDVVYGYSALTGFNPSTGENDNGAYEAEVLEYWRRTGVGGHRIRAHATVRIDPQWLKLANLLFGGVYIGLDLPVSAQHQKVWTAAKGPDGEPGGWGGHCVVIEKTTEAGGVMVTWGERKQFKWDFVAEYCTEAHAVILPEWQATDHPGFDEVALDSYLGALKHK